MPFVTAESTARARQLCQQLATHRTILGLTQRDLAAHFNGAASQTRPTPPPSTPCRRTTPTTTRSTTPATPSWPAW